MRRFGTLISSVFVFMFGVFVHDELRERDMGEMIIALAGILFIVGIVQIVKSKSANSTPTVFGNPFLPNRFKMLRHSAYYQLATLRFGQELTPHQFHWRIQEALEDQGLEEIKSTLPSISTHWSKVVPGENGHEANRADYLPFEGGLIGSKGQPVPLGLKIMPFVFFILFQITYNPYEYENYAAMFMGFLGFSSIIAIILWRRYRRGFLNIYYRGTYIQPKGDNGASGHHNDWEFSIDLMISINSHVAPFINYEAGLALVEPMFTFVRTNERSIFEDNTFNKIQSTMISSNPEEFEQRFPVEYTNKNRTD